MKNFKIIMFLVISTIGCASRSQNKSNIKIEKVSDFIHVLYGGGGNVGVFSGEDGILLVDDKYAKHSENVINAIKSIHNGTIVYTLNTHFHKDHVDGNTIFGDEGSIIVAHHNTRDRLKTNQVIVLPGGKAMQQDIYKEKALPSITFEDSMNIFFNNQRLSLHHIENAHTDTDIIVHFKDANVIHTGDVYITTGIPFVDKGNGGSILGTLEGLKKILQLTNNETILIPGHGKSATSKELSEYIDKLFFIIKRVAELKKKGRTKKEIIEINPVKDLLKSSGGKTPEYLLNMIFEEITK